MLRSFRHIGILGFASATDAIQKPSFELEKMRSAASCAQHLDTNFMGQQKHCSPKKMHQCGSEWQQQANQMRARNSTREL